MLLSLGHSLQSSVLEEGAVLEGLAVLNKA